MDLSAIQAELETWREVKSREFRVITGYTRRLLDKANAVIAFDMQVEHTLVSFGDTVLDDSDRFNTRYLLSYISGQFSQSDGVLLIKDLYSDSHTVRWAECTKHDRNGFSCDSIVYIRFSNDVYKEYAKIGTQVELFTDNPLNTLSNLQLRDASFIESILNEVLAEYKAGYVNGIPDKTIEHSAQGLLLQVAGDRFVGEISSFYSSVLIDDNGLWLKHNQFLLSQLNNISSLKYEKAENEGQLLLCPENSILCDALDIEFEDSPDLNEYKKIRKLLEVAKKNTALVVAGTSAHGFISKDKIASLVLEKSRCLFVEIKGILNWRISLCDFSQAEVRFHTLIEKKLSDYRYPVSIINKGYFAKTVEAVFSNGADVEEMWRIIESAVDQKNGTMIVFSGIAASEADKYRDCSFKVRTTEIPAKHLSEDMIDRITAIDGAVLCDEKGVCHSLGVILDGKHENGSGEDISNGARHNSALRYYNANKGNCVIAIVSEDGEVKLLPVG